MISGNDSKNIYTFLKIIFTKVVLEPNMFGSFWLYEISIGQTQKKKKLSKPLVRTKIYLRMLVGLQFSILWVNLTIMHIRCIF